MMILIFICVVLRQFKSGCGCSHWGDLSFDVEAGLRRPAAVGARHGVDIYITETCGAFVLSER